MSRDDASSADVTRSLEAILAREAARPFGGMQMISGRTLEPFSSAGRQGAGNLLRKATRALEAGETERARRYVEAAARLPFDEHERAAPAALAVHQDLFDLVTDAVEGSEPDDHRWLDAALAVLETAEEPARFELRDVLAAIDQDYQLPSAERQRIRAANATIPEHAALVDLNLGEAELSDRIMSILVVGAAYRADLLARSV